MKRSLAIFVLIGGGLLAEPIAAWAAEALNVKAMTFNIRYNNKNDGPNCWSERREMAADVIRRFDGDFVNLQEALPDQIADLLKMLPDYQMLGRSREADPSRGEAGPIFYRHKRWQLDKEQQGTFWLSDTPQKPGSITWGNACTRIVTWGRFIDAETKRGIYVYNTHFDHISNPARQKSAVLLAQRIAERTKPEPVIVTGDFNAGESSKAVTFLTDKTSIAPIQLIDTFRVLHPEAKEVGTFHNFCGGTEGQKIDYIFVLPDTKILSAAILHDHCDNRYPSDHFPVTAEVAFPSESSK